MLKRSVKLYWSGRLGRCLLLVGFASALILGCKNAQAGNVAFSLPQPTLSSDHMVVKSWQSLKFASTIHQKYDFSCGSAALATLLTYVYRVPVSEKTVFKSMLLHGNKAVIEKSGFSLLDMKNYLARHGVKSGGYEATLAQLAALRVPAVALINYHGYNHFVVVRGIQDGNVLISDPSLGLRIVAAKTFNKEWTKIFFIVTNDVQQARVSFNAPAVWKKVPGSPFDLAEFQIRNLAFPASGMRSQLAF